LDSRGYYAVFGVSEHASYQEIKRAYRRLARKYHPDRNTSGISDEMIKTINAAFEILSDKDKRHNYDHSEGYEMDRSATDQESEQHANSKKENSYAHHNTTFNSPNSNNYNFAKMNEASSRRSDSQNNYVQFAEFDTNSTLITGLLDIPKGRFHLIVEPSLCMAFGSCETLAPKVFVVEKNKRINPKAKVASEVDATFDEILSAAQTCPTKAIKIIDRYTGEQIYP
jgi:ferredoxin